MLKKIASLKPAKLHICKHSFTCKLSALSYWTDNWGQSNMLAAICHDALPWCDHAVQDCLSASCQCRSQSKQVASYKAKHIKTQSEKMSRPFAQLPTSSQYATMGPNIHHRSILQLTCVFVVPDYRSVSGLHKAAGRAFTEVVEDQLHALHPFLLGHFSHCCPVLHVDERQTINRQWALLPSPCTWTRG